MRKKWLSSLFLSCLISVSLVVPVSAQDLPPSQDQSSSVEISIPQDINSQITFSKSVESPKTDSDVISPNKPSASTQDNPSNTVTFCYDETTQTTQRINKTIEPLKTCTGNSGTVRLVYTAGADWDDGVMFWSVNPGLSPQ